MGPTWGPSGSCRPQMGPMLAPWTLLSGMSSLIGYDIVTISRMGPSLHTPTNQNYTTRNADHPPFSSISSSITDRYGAMNQTIPLCYATNIPRAHYTKYPFTVQWTFHFVAGFQITTNFAYATTLVRSWHVRNIVVITFHWGLNIFSHEIWIIMQKP